MTSGFKTLAFSGLGILGAGAISTGGYSIWNNANPTGSARLLSSGYTFNPPKFTRHENLDHGCSETIFKEDADFENNKLYGCGVASISIWDSGSQFSDKNKTIDYLTFNSEISMRKGDDGWKINTIFDNRSDTTAEHAHYVTTYKKENNEGWKEKDTFYITPPINNVQQPSELEIDKGGSKYEIYTGKKELNIKIPSESWYKNKDYLFVYQKKSDSSAIAPRSYLHETFKDRKFWSGIWVEGSNESSWILQDIEVFIDDKKYSKFFCKNNGAQTNGCWQNETNLETNIYKKSENTDEDEDEEEEKGEEGTWRYASNVHGSEEEATTSEDSGTQESQVSKKVSPIIEKIKDSKGKWVDTKEFCNYGYARNIDEKQLKDLKMFCSTKKK